jgi:hypothetical protein
MDEREQAIRAKIQRLALEQLSYRDIVDRLAAEGFSRTLSIQVIKKMNNEKRILPDYSGPIALALFSAALLFWGFTPAPIDAPDYVRSLKWILAGAAGVAFVPSLFAIAYKFYDRIPALNVLLEPIIGKQRLQQPDIVALDDQFLNGELRELDYEKQLVSLLGQQRGRSHFRFMRNQKHFGLH